MVCGGTADGVCVCVGGVPMPSGWGGVGCWLPASCKTSAEIIGACFKQIKFFLKEL